MAVIKIAEHLKQLKEVPPELDVDAIVRAVAQAGLEGDKKVAEAVKYIKSR